MRIGIVGSGQVGQALGRGYARHGHEVVLGTGHPDRDDLAAWSAETGARVSDFAGAAEHGQLVVLALRGDATVHVVSTLTAPLAGTVVVDATNPLEFGEAGPTLFVSGDDSLGERVQRAAPESRVVKAYNTVGNTLMVDPELPGGPPTMFIAGDDDAAKGEVEGLLRGTGWDVVDLGGIVASRWLEAMTMAWVAYGARTGTWQHAFKLLR